MRRKRLVWFVMMIALGLAAGLYYGWVINPVQYVDVPPQSLRADYKADYVLMVAEIYGADGDLAAAEQRLAFFGSVPAADVVSEGIVTAQTIGYAEHDLQLMSRLSMDLLKKAPTPTTTGQASP